MSDEALLFFLTVSFLALLSVNGDLYLFSNGDDPSAETTFCLDHFETIQASTRICKFCDEHCSKMVSSKASSVSYDSSSSEKTDDILSSGKGSLLSLTGVLHFYRNFVFSIFNRLNKTLYIRLTSYEMNKLKRFAESTLNAESASLVPDITDVLKSMIVNEVHEHKLPSVFEMILGETSFSTSQLIGYTFLLMALVYCRIQIRRGLLFREKLIALLCIFFCISCINNHHYLGQKKQLFKQQKLQEDIPMECKAILDQNHTQIVQNDSLHSTVMRFFRYHLGYKATLPICLEYLEALYLTTNQNYVESIVYTLTEALLPIFFALGESINKFYTALCKDLTFFESILVVTCVSIAFVAQTVFTSAFLSLLCFKYDLNFFQLISFRKSQSTASTPASQLNANTYQQTFIQPPQHQQQPHFLPPARRRIPKYIRTADSDFLPSTQ